MNLWRFSLREIWSRPGRALLTMLSVVLGVASLVAVTLATGATRQAYKDLFSAVAGKADLLVSVEGEGGFSESVELENGETVNLIEELDKVPGLAAVVPSLQQPCKMYGQTAQGKDIHVTLQAMGVEPQRDKAVRDYVLAEGRYLERENEAVVDAGFAENVGLTVGQKIRLVSRQQSRTEFEIVGTIKLQGAAGITQAGIIFLPLKQAQKMFRSKGKIDAIHLVLEKGADKHKVQEAVAAALPPNLSIAPPPAGSQLAEEQMLAPEVGLFIATTISLVVSGFIIVNTFFINVSERRRQLAVLRAIGATRSQIRRLLVTEGVLLGIVGTLLGMGMGVVGAYFLTRAMEGLFQASLPAVHFAFTPFVLAGLFGVGVSFLGTLLPALAAGRVSPLEGMGGMVGTDSKAKAGHLLLLGVSMFVLGGVFMALAVFDLIPVGLLNVVGFLFRLFGAADTVEPGIVVSLLGTVMQVVGSVFILREVLLRPLVSGTAALLSPVLRVESRLARQQLLRRRTRTTLTIGVMFMAVSFGIGIAITLLDNVQDVQNWYRKSIIGDFFVRVMMPDILTGKTADIPEEFRDDLNNIPGIDQERIGRAKFVPARAAPVPAEGEKPNFQQIVVIAREFRIQSTATPGARLDLKDTDPVTARERLLAGEIVISTVLAQRTGLKKGDRILIDTSEGPQELPIAATANDYIASGLIVYMDRGTAEKLLGIEGANAYVIDALKGQHESVEAALKELCTKHGLLLQSQAEINRMIDGMMSGVIACQWVIVVAVFCASGFGIVITLTMNVLEQTRELGLLRIVAMTRWQVRKLILAQAVIMGLIGLVPGVITGLFVAWYINFSTLAVTGHPVEFEIRWAFLVGCFAVGFLMVLVAAWYPAERAARLDLATALQYE